ncbi:MAG TPA: hypothetical protein VLD66_06850 [Methyloceanibacter sp.]|nr:hypothetical protein [Methyloceanibacter sp.]
MLCGFSVANYALLYVTSILLARTLSVPDFDDYNVAVSSVLVLTSLATLGLEKYALRCLPAWQNHQDWARSRGFLLFARKLILFTSVVLVILFCLTLELALSMRGKPYHMPSSSWRCSCRRPPCSSSSSKWRQPMAGR